MEGFQKIELNKTRNFSEKINVTFEFIRQNFKALFLSILYISVPFSIIGTVIVTYLQFFRWFGSTETFGIDWFGEGFAYFIVAYVLMIFGYLLNISVVYNFLRLYKDHPDPTNITVAEVWEKSKGDIGPLFGAGILVAIVVMVGFVVFIIPGIYLGVVLSLIGPVIVIERKSIGESFNRCFYLISEKWWSTFGLIFVMAILQGVMSMVFAVPQFVFTFLVTFHYTSTDLFTEPPLWHQVGMLLSSSVTAAGRSLLMTLPTLAIAFQFYNLVERREAAGLMSRLETFGKQDSSPADNQETY